MEICWFKRKVRFLRREHSSGDREGSYKLMKNAKALGANSKPNLWPLKRMALAVKTKNQPARVTNLKPKKKSLGEKKDQQPRKLNDPERKVFNKPYE
jgi:hypothetical protein